MNKNLIPKIRFQGFDNQWTTVKIQDLGKIQSGKTPPTNAKNWANDVSWYTTTDMTSKYLTKSKRQISWLASQKNPLVPIQSILFSRVGTIGKIGITTVLSSCTGNICFISKLKNHVEYVYYLLQCNIHLIKAHAFMQVIIPKISKAAFEKVIVYTSNNIQEQTKIAKFLGLIDQQITLTQEKTKFLQQQKEYYLNHMFI